MCHTEVYHTEVYNTEVYHTEVVGRIKHILRLTIFFPKSFHLRGNVEKFGRALQVTDNNVIRR